MKTNYHKPVLLDESVSGLNIQPGGVYVDVTYGGGGHSRKILDIMDGGKLIAFDQDRDASENYFNDVRLFFVDGNFRYLKNYLKYYDAYPCDGILADLGVASHQIDDPERGFSTRFDGPLDLRMDKRQEFSARELINSYEFEELSRVLKNYGEIKNARAVARAIIRARSEKTLANTGQLKEVISKFSSPQIRQKFLAKVFQAIRIEVNQEMKVLEEFLSATPEALKPGGRLSVISYHSLEDRMVKNMIKAGNIQGEMVKDFYGNVQKPFHAINKKVIISSDEEIKNNSRARSARLRIAEKI